MFDTEPFSIVERVTTSEILFFENEQQRALPVGTDATKMDVILWAKFLDEIFADGDAVILDEDVADGHVRRAGEHLVETRRFRRPP